MDVQLLGQTQRSIVEWIVHKTKILNNYKAKVRKVKGCPPIKLDIKSEIFPEHEEFNWVFILLVSKGEKVQTRYSLTQEERGLSRWERVPFQPLFDLKSNRKSNFRLRRTHAKMLSTNQRSIDKGNTFVPVLLDCCMSAFFRHFVFPRHLSFPILQREFGIWCQTVFSLRISC